MKTQILTKDEIKTISKALDKSEASLNRLMNTNKEVEILHIYEKEINNIHKLRIKITQGDLGI